MTPYQRILRNDGLAEFARNHTRPKPQPDAFPRNNSGLTVLCLAVLPLLFKTILDPTGENILGYGGTTIGFGLGLWSIAHGFYIEARYDAKKVAKASKVPFKLVGSALMGVSAAGLTLFQGGDPVQCAGVLAVVLALAVVAFGMDPRRNKGLETVKDRHSHKLDGLTAQVGLQMERIRTSAAALAETDVMPLIRAFDDSVDALLTAALRDPERAGTLRKFFGVYLDGAAEASERFASVYSGTGDIDAREKYFALLDKLTKAYTAKAHDYAASGQIKMDVQIDVLNESLANESRRHQTAGA